ncbi:MAG: glycosyltransferase [Bacteroidota bacterium]
MSQERKRILISIDWFAPGYKAGGPIRSCVNFAYGMRDQYDIYIITGDRDFGDYQSYKNIQTNSWIEFDTGIKVYYADPDSLSLSFWRKEISKLNPDFVYLNNLFSTSFCFLPLLARKSSAPHAKWILAPRGMLHAGAIQYKRFKKQLYLSSLKILGLSRNLHFQATDEQEQKDIDKYFHPKTPIQIIENLPHSKLRERVARKKDKGFLKAIFFSRISPKKNLDFFLEILRGTRARLDLDIIGPIEDAQYWEHCQKLASELEENLNMEYLGVFPHEEVMNQLENYHLFVLPTHGENFGHAIFEAILSACPVLISDQTPWRNLESKKVGWDIPLSDTDKYKEVIEDLTLMDQEHWDSWSESSWLYGKTYLEHSKTKERYKHLFQHA